VEKYGRAGQATDDNIIRRMRFTCWITKATDTQSEYVILIAFPRQQWSRERASLLRVYVHCQSCYLSKDLLLNIKLYDNKSSNEYVQLEVCRRAVGPPFSATVARVLKCLRLASLCQYCDCPVAGGTSTARYVDMHRAERPCCFTS
jgi:hypothetical protein